jgi:hypothetical protein
MVLVVVDVELCGGIGFLGSLECNSDEVFTEHGGEHRGSKASLLIEHFIHDILTKSAQASRSGESESYPL